MNTTSPIAPGAAEGVASKKKQAAIFPASKHPLAHAGRA